MSENIGKRSNSFSISKESFLETIVMLIRLGLYGIMVYLAVAIKLDSEFIDFQTLMQIGFLGGMFMLFAEIWEESQENKFFSVFFVYSTIFLASICVIGIIFEAIGFQEAFEQPFNDVTQILFVVLLGLLVGEVIVSLFGRNRAIATLKQSSDAIALEGKLSFWEHLKRTLKKQRYSTSILFFVFGMIVLFTGGNAELSMLYNYILPLIAIIPFPIILANDLMKLEKDKDIIEYLKSQGAFTSLIEGLIMVIIFLLCVFVVWDLFPTGFQATWEIESWYVVSYGFSFGITLVVHAFWGLNKITDYGSSFGNTTSSGAVAIKGDYDFAKTKRIEFFASTILSLSVFGIALYYIADSLAIIMDEGASLLNLSFVVGLSSLALLLLHYVETESIAYLYSLARNNKEREYVLENYPPRLKVFSLLIVVASGLYIASQIWEITNTILIVFSVFLGLSLIYVAVPDFSISVPKRTALIHRNRDGKQNQMRVLKSSEDLNDRGITIVKENDVNMFFFDQD